ncbi:beta-glucosidase [Bacillus sp. JCM 19046]|nr:beta-glucosidase [Bacillus sp. JCM 19046]
MERHAIDVLLEKMTLDEKIGQLMQYAGAFYSEEANDTPVTGPAELPINQHAVKKSGSVLGVAGAKKTIGIQKEHLKSNRLGIPLLFMADVINGFRTIFPIPLALGSTWEPELVQQAQSVAAKEAASAGVHVCFAPMVDLVRDPRWGRVMESTGEDSFLNSRFAEATVKGFQGNDLRKEFDRVAACVKHFAAYGAAEAGRDYNTVDMSERELREQYLPAYKAALDAGSELVMTAFNTVDSVPATGNKPLMRGILREEFGFEGVLISDYGAVGELIPHGVAENEKEAAQKAITAGVDIEMMSLCYENDLKGLVETGEVSIDLVDEAVLRILQLKEKLGLFDDPYRGVSEGREEQTLFTAEHRELARKTAEKSAVLLKNNGVLPLKTKKIALIGPYGDNKDILGEWSIFGKQEEAVTLKEGLALHSEQIVYAAGAQMYERDQERFQEAMNLAKSVDTVVLALGEGRDRSGEAEVEPTLRLKNVS